MSICRMLAAESRILGADSADVKASSASQMANFSTTIRSSIVGLADAEQLLAALNEPSPAFDESQRVEIAKCVSLTARTAAAHVSATVASASTNGKGQMHMFMFNYLGGSDWDYLFDLNHTFTECLHRMGDKAITIRLRNLREISKTSVVSIVSTARNERLSASVHYEKVLEFGKIMWAKRMSTPGVPLQMEYPEDGVAFAQLHPELFDEPPIPSRLSKESIMEVVHIQPSRSSHASLAGTVYSKRLSSSKRPSSQQHDDKSFDALSYILACRAQPPPPPPSGAPVSDAVVPSPPPSGAHVSGAVVPSPPPTGASASAVAPGTIESDPSRAAVPPCVAAGESSACVATESTTVAAVRAAIARAKSKRKDGEPTDEAAAKRARRLAIESAFAGTEESGDVAIGDPYGFDDDELEDTTGDAATDVGGAVAAPAMKAMKAMKATATAKAKAGSKAEGKATAAPKANGKATAKSTATDKAKAGPKAKGKAKAVPKAKCKAKAEPMAKGKAKALAGPTKGKVAAAGGHPPIPPVSMKCMFNGGRIYFSHKKFAFRAYRRWHDKVEKTVTVAQPRKAEQVKDAFIKSCELINDDPRPRS